MKPPAWRLGPRVANPIEILAHVAQCLDHRRRVPHGEAAWLAYGLRIYLRGGVTLDEALGLRGRPGKPSAVTGSKRRHRNDLLREAGARLPGCVKVKADILAGVAAGALPPPSDIEALLSLLQELPPIPRSPRQLFRILANDTG